ncbi:MAG: cyclic nucleotide-binding domain-containing protein [Desulfobacteraceae bacterium]|jgi:CRP/FNR family transcriptional regulator
MDLPLGYLFKGLNEDQLGRIMAITREVSMEDGEVIFKEGEESGAVYILKNGAVELITQVENDFELPIATLRKPGEIVGTSALVSPCQYSLTARCTGKGTLLSIDRSALLEAMSEDPDLGYIIMTNLAKYFFDKLKETRQELRIHFHNFKTLFIQAH